MLERITIFCFAASYAVALTLELWRQLRPWPILRLAAASIGGAGLVAHAAYLGVQALWLQRLSLLAPMGSLLFLALILAVFYLYGSLHYRRLAWGLFVLPVVLGLIGLAVLNERRAPREAEQSWDNFWGMTHWALLLFAAVGVCVGFVASVMYLVQVRRLRAKVPPGEGVRLLSLERLEAMNRRAILAAFPLLTAGLLVGMVLQLHHGTFLQSWYSPKILSGLVVWVIFALLLHLRYWAHARGRQVAVLTVIAFVFLMVALVAPVHPFVQGSPP